MTRYSSVHNVIHHLNPSHPTECHVVLPAPVDADGHHPIGVGDLPRACAALNRTFLNVVELTVAAALEGDRRLVHQAAILDPNASANLPLDDIHAMCDELIEAHGDRMPPGIRA